MRFNILIKIFPVIIVFVAIVFAALPLLRSGFLPTHDGEYHIIRFFEFEKMLRNGVIFPRWAPGLNSGYGIPLFNFFYPFPNYVGSVFHSLGWSLTDAFKLSLALSYITAGLFCFLWLLKLFDSFRAAAGSIIFSFVPYWFVDIYVRGSIGEVFAISFLMLAFAAIEWGMPKIVSISIAGIIVSHNILSIVFLPILAGYMIIRKKNYFVNFILGTGLTMYFWLPALLERNYVVGLNSVNFKDYFPSLDQLLIPSWGTGFSGGELTGNVMSPQLGTISLIVIFMSLFVILKKENHTRSLALFFFILLGISCFLMQKISLFIWNGIGVLAFLQYPWRLLSIFPVAVAFLSAYISYMIHNKWLLVGLVMVAMLTSYAYTRPAIYAPRADDYYLNKREFTDGTSSLGNSFSTRWSEWKKERADEKIVPLSGSAKISNINIQPIFYNFKINAQVKSTIQVNTLYYPGWQVRLDNRVVPIDYTHDGTITFTVPKGNYSAWVGFTETPLRLFADFGSIVSLFWIVGSAILNRYVRRYRHFSNAGRT